MPLLHAQGPRVEQRFVVLHRPAIQDTTVVDRVPTGNLAMAGALGLIAGLVGGAYLGAKLFEANCVEDNRDFPMPLGADVDLESIADRTNGYTGADLEDLTRRAGLQALREDINIAEIPMRLFESAMKETRASVTEEMEREYKELAETLKSESPRGRRKQIGFDVGGNPIREAVAAD